MPSGPADATLHWFGFESRGPATVPREVAPFTNVLLVREWQGKSDSILDAVRASGLTAILTFHNKETTDIRTVLPQVMQKHRDVVAAVCWEEPYYNRISPVEVSAVGQWLKREYLNCQYWISFVGHTNKTETSSVPAEVDAVVVNLYWCVTPHDIHTQAERDLPYWMEKASGRPVVLRWVPNSVNGPPDAIAKCLPGTIRALAQAATEYRLAGLILSRYGDFRYPTISSTTELVAETRETAERMGFVKPDTSPPKR